MQTLGALCMRGTANWWAELWLCVSRGLHTRVWHRLVTPVDSMRESTHPFSCYFLCLILRANWSGQVKAVQWCFFACYHTWAQSFQENHNFILQVRVPLKHLVRLITRLVPCSARISIDKQTDRQTKYYNPRCACVPRLIIWALVHGKHYKGGQIELQRYIDFVDEP